MRTTAAIACAALVVAGCAAGQARFTKQSEGRIIGSSIHSEYHEELSVSGPIWVLYTTKGRFIVPTVNWPKTRTQRLYVVELTHGPVVTTTDERTFNIGSCVLLRHATDLSLVTPAANHVDGRLETSSSC